MRMFLQSEYRNSLFINNSPDQRVLEKNIEHYDCIAGHFGYLFWDQKHKKSMIPSDVNRELKYITMLRDPVDRMISLYYYTTRGRHKDTFEQFVDHPPPSYPFRHANSQTLMLTGDGTTNIDLAKKNVKEKFLIVGIMELYNDSWRLMKENLGWKNNKYTLANKSNHPTRDDIPKHVLHKIKVYNEKDIQLYEYAKSLLLSKI